MRKILSADILDILPLEVGFMYAEKQTMKTGEETVAFFVYDQDRERVLPVKAGMYLEAKFGKGYRTIAEKIGDYISCDAVILPSGAVATLFSGGDMTIFNPDCSIAWSGQLLYQGFPAKDLALDGNAFWCTVPDKNAIIRYSPIERRVLLRIGGGTSTAFKRPVAITKIDSKLYICNETSNKIRTIRLEDYAVKDYIVFDEAIHKYFKVGFFEYVILDSGIYCLNDNK